MKISIWTSPVTLLVGLVFTFSNTAAAATHPASQYVEGVLGQGQSVMSSGSEQTKFEGTCDLFKHELALDHLQTAWLGNFAGLAREKSAVAKFRKMIPAIFISTALAAIGFDEIGSATITVKSSASGSGGFYRVGVSINNAGKSFSGNVVVQDLGGGDFKFADAEYLFVSAINYIGGDYLKLLNAEYKKDPNTSMPVTALINYIESQPGYEACK